MIALCPGHHEADKGRWHNGTSEYDLAVVWVKEIANGLQIPYEIISGKLSEKVTQINRLDCDLAIDLHFNSSVGGLARGSETLYHPDSEDGLYYATQLQQVIAKIFKPDRGVKAGYYKLDPSKGIDYFLRETTCSAVILEPEFIQQLDLINTNRSLCCRAISDKLNELFS